jgi:hypothetical protein
MEFLRFESVGVMAVLPIVLVFKIGQGWVDRAK